jgi:arsenate reductase (thioredoxin)
MGCGAACPIYPGKRYLDWMSPTPSNESDIRDDDLQARITALLRDLNI